MPPQVAHAQSGLPRNGLAGKYLRTWWLFCLVLTSPFAAFADSIYLNAEGQKNLDVLRLRLRPAPIFQDAQGQSFIRGVIVGERAALDPKAPYNTIQGSPEYDVVAFDASGDQRSATVAISDAWINYIQNDIDSELDIRYLFSDRDRLAGVALGSRAYFGMVRRAADPDGALGLWRNDVALPPEPPGVLEGGIVRFLKDPPIVTAADPYAEKWGMQRRAALDALIKKTLAQRLPKAHMHRTDMRPSLEIEALVEAIARERAYRLSRTGFERAALGMLVFIFDLASVTHREPPTGGNRADAIYFEGSNSVRDAIVSLESALPSFSSGAVPCSDNTPFCVDSSQRAEVIIDALLASDGLFHSENWWRILTELLVGMHQPSPDGTRPRVDVRDGARRLLAHCLNPPPGRDADSERRRRGASREMRKAVYKILFDDEEFAGQHRTARAALAAGGWGATEELMPFTRGLFDATIGYAGRSADGSGDLMRRKAAEGIATLRMIAALGGSQVAAERQASALVLDSVEQVRKRQREGTSDSQGDKIFLAMWSAQ
jgi:hypothetical protein